MADVRKPAGTRDATRGQYTKPGVRYPTPDPENDFIIVERSTKDSKAQPIAYGTAHPSVETAKLIDQSFVNEEDNAKTRIRVYSAHGTPAQQDVWNAALSYSGESNAHQILVRAYTLQRQGYEAAAKGTADSVVSAAKLVKEDTQPIEGDHWHHRVIRIFETLPGPWLPFTRYDDDLGPIQGRRRAVLAAGQTASLTGTAKTSYEARDGSSIVSWEIQENWSNGSGTTGNPAYPIATTDFYDTNRGPVEQTSQIVVKTGNEVGSLTLVGGVVTQTRYEPYNEFLLRKIVETWSVPGPTLLQTTVDDDGNTVVVAKTLKDITAITEGDSIGGGSLVITTSEAFLEPVAWEVTRTRVLPGAWIAAAPKYDDALGPIAVRRRLVAKSGQVATLTATKQTTYEAWNGSNLVAWEIEESWSDGSGEAGNPAYPIQTSKVHDDTRGPVARTVQLIVKAGTEAGTIAHNAGSITETSYTPFNEYLLRKQVDVWTLAAAPVQRTTPYDTSRGEITQTATLLAKTGSEVASLTETGGTLTETRYEPLNAVVVRRVVEVWSVPGPTLIDTAVDNDGNTVIVAKTLKAIGAITEGDTLEAGSLVLTTSEAFAEPVAWEVTKTRAIPGAWIASAPKYDEALGPIRVRRRLVEKSGQASSLTATTQTTYEAWPDSNLVAWEIEESWSDGTGATGNPAYPVQTSKIYDDTRGPVARTVQLKVKAGTEEGSVAHAADTITETSYTAYNEYLLRRQVDVWVLSSAPVVSDKPYDTQRGAIAQTTTLVAKTGSEEASLVESGGTVTETSFKPLNDAVLRRIEEVWAVPGPTLLDTEVNDDGSTTVVAKTLKAISSITEGEVYSAPSLIITTSEAYKEPIAWEVTRTRTLPGPLVHSIEYLNNDKELPRVTTRQVVATEASYTPGEQGVATCPVAGFEDLLLAEQELERTDRASLKEDVRVYQHLPGYVLTGIQTDPETNLQYTVTRRIVAEATALPANEGGKVYEKQPIDDVQCIHIERDMTALIGVKITDAPEISYTFPGLLFHRGRTLTERSQPASYRAARSLVVRARREIFYTAEKLEPETFQWFGVSIRSDAGSFGEVLHNLTSVEIGGRRQRVEESFPTASEYPIGEEVLIRAPSERGPNGLFRNEHIYIELV